MKKVRLVKKPALLHFNGTDLEVGMQIEHSSALITGAGSGLGAATAKAMKAKGAQIYWIDKDIDRVQSLASSIGGVALACDVSKAKEVKELFDSIKTPLHIVVNCAGVAPAMKMLSKDRVISDSHFEDVLKINLFGTFNVMRSAYAHMVAHQSSNTKNDVSNGVIINTASIAASEGQIGQVAYSASKAGVVGMMLPAVREFARYGVRVNTISPGIMETPMMQGMPDKVQTSLLANVPHPCRYGRAEEYASLACQIIENDYINGANFRLDAGMRMAAT